MTAAYQGLGVLAKGIETSDGNLTRLSDGALAREPILGPCLAASQKRRGACLRLRLDQRLKRSSKPN